MHPNDITLAGNTDGMKTILVLQEVDYMSKKAPADRTESTEASSIWRVYEGLSHLDRVYKYSSHLDNVGDFANGRHSSPQAKRSPGEEYLQPIILYSKDWNKSHKYHHVPKVNQRPHRGR